jgi:feruloyl esterase
MRRIAALFLCLFPASATSSFAATCDELTRVSRAGLRVVSSVVVEKGAFQPGPAERAASSRYSALEPFCRVALVAAPSADSEINIEVWLPMSRWNGRYQAVGAGGLAGSIPFGLMASALAGGYATSGTDTGHRGGNADFMPDHPEKLTDFAHRSTHEMAAAAKLMIDAFYGKTPARGAAGRASPARNDTPRTSTESFRVRRRGIRRAWMRRASRLTSSRTGLPTRRFLPPSTR